MKENNKKTKAKKLSDAICRSLPRLDKAYYKPGDYPGLEFWIMPGGTGLPNSSLTNRSNVKRKLMVCRPHWCHSRF